MADVQLVDTLNKRWKEDKTGFGFRMLQKMGWKEDKGLGKNETGIVSSVKIKKREEKIGLGMEHDAVGNKGWSETANSFNAVLQVLQETYKTSETKKKVKKSSLKISVGMK